MEQNCTVNRSKKICVKGDAKNYKEPDTFILEKKIQEPLMVTCTLPAPSENVQHQISCINLNSGLRISRCMLGFDSENRLFKSQRLQAALSYCHKNVESWYREVRIAPNLHQMHEHPKASLPKPTECGDCKKLNKLCPEHDPRKLSDSKHKQLITKEVIEKFPKSKKWYRHFKLLGLKTENSLEKYQDLDESVDGVEKIKSIERYKDMSRLIEERFGKKSYNPVKKSASFMFSSKRIDLEETPTNSKSNPALLKCQSLDTQLYTIEEPRSEAVKPKKSERRSSKSNISESLSYDFQMCILENDSSVVDSKQMNLVKTEGQSLKDLRTTHFTVTNIDFDEIKPAEEVQKLKKNKPDLIPTLPKDDNSYITDRLCSEFHVKTKVQKRSVSKQNLLTNVDRSRSSVRSTDIRAPNLSIFDVEINRDELAINTTPQNPNVKSVVVQVHEVSKTKLLAQNKLKITDIDDIPYSQVVDEIREKPSGKRSPEENIYAEICENAGNCDNKKVCQCKRTKNNSEYCYVKLGSNGDSVTQSDSDEAIYNTLR